MRIAPKGTAMKMRGMGNGERRAFIASAMICCEATLVGRAVLSPPRRVWDNALYLPLLRHCRTYINAAHRAALRRRSAARNDRIDN